MNANTETNQQVRAYMLTLKAIAETIRELKSVPSGHLYAQLMGKMSLEVYNGIISKLEGAGMVSRGEGHLLTWIGPKA